MVCVVGFCLLGVFCGRCWLTYCVVDRLVWFWLCCLCVLLIVLRIGYLLLFILSLGFS